MPLCCESRSHDRCDLARHERLSASYLVRELLASGFSSNEGSDIGRVRQRVFRLPSTVHELRLGDLFERSRRPAPPPLPHLFFLSCVSILRESMCLTCVPYFRYRMYVSVCVCDMIRSDPIYYDKRIHYNNNNHNAEVTVKR